MKNFVFGTNSALHPMSDVTARPTPKNNNGTTKEFQE